MLRSSLCNDYSRPFPTPGRDLRFSSCASPWRPPVSPLKCNLRKQVHWSPFFMAQRSPAAVSCSPGFGPPSLPSFWRSSYCGLGFRVVPMRCHSFSRQSPYQRRCWDLAPGRWMLSSSAERELTSEATGQPLKLSRQIARCQVHQFPESAVQDGLQGEEAEMLCFFESGRRRHADTNGRRLPQSPPRGSG
jgi:hypothetical protein